MATQFPLDNPFESPRAAVDASSLIVLAKVGRIGLLAAVGEDWP